MKKSSININVSDLMPLAILLLMVIIFGISTGGAMFSGSNMINLFNQSLATMIAALGMVFVAAMGGTDITHGSLSALSTTLGFMVAYQVGYWAFIPVTILVGAASGLLMGVVNAKFKVPSFMASLALLIGYRAMVNLIMASNAYILFPELSFLNSLGFDLVALIVLILIITYVFHYTPYGVYVKAIGENENAVKLTGINVTKVKIIAFMISGIMAAIGGIFLSARIGGTSNTLGTGFEMKVMMAMFIGGIPVQGGMGSKIHKIIIGAPTITLLENGLVLSGVDGSYTQLIRGVVLIAAIFITGVVNEKFSYGLKVKKAAPAAA